MRNISSIRSLRASVRALLLVVLTLLPLTASAEQVVVDGLRYDLAADNATLSGIADSTITVLNIPSTINVGENEYTVTAVGAWAFSGNYSLLTVNLPESLTAISDFAFAWCGNL